MSQAIHVGTEYERDVQWFECPRCGARQAMTSYLWSMVPVIGEKSTLDVCEHRPHIPPSPSAVANHERDMEMVKLLEIVARG